MTENEAEVCLLELGAGGGMLLRLGKRIIPCLGRGVFIRNSAWKVEPRPRLRQTTLGHLVTGHGSGIHFHFRADDVL